MNRNKNDSLLYQLKFYYSDLKYYVQIFYLGIYNYCINNLKIEVTNKNIIFQSAFPHTVPGLFLLIIQYFHNF